MSSYLAYAYRGAAPATYCTAPGFAFANTCCGTTDSPAAAVDGSSVGDVITYRLLLEPDGTI